MNFPPIDHADLVALGMPADAAIGSVDGSLVCGDNVPQFVADLLSAAVASPPPDDDRLAYVRHVRGLLLSLTDYTQLGDSPLTAEARAAWATYRQALRDLPHVYSGSGPIPWPTIPG